MANHLLCSPHRQPKDALPEACISASVGSMLLKEAYLNRVVGEVEDLAERVARLKTRFARQKVSVRLEHYWELEHVRTQFVEFKRCVRDLESADQTQAARLQEAVEVAWKELVHAVDALLEAIP